MLRRPTLLTPLINKPPPPNMSIQNRRSLQWLSLIAVIWLQSINGTNSNFPAYSSHLKTLLSISQIQLNNLAFASDAGKLFGWVSGLAALYLPLWLVLLIGSALGFVGYGVQYLFASHNIHNLSYVQVFVLTVVAGNSICWINTVCYIVTIRNFSSERQAAVGITTSYLGLSAKIYTEIVDAFFPAKRAESYLLLNAVLPLVVCATASPLARDFRAAGKTDKMRASFVSMFMITVVTGVYAVMSSMGSISRLLPPVANASGILSFLLVPLLIPSGHLLRRIVRKKRQQKIHVADSDLPGMEGGEVLSEEAVKDNKEIISVTVTEEVKVREEIGVKKMVTRVEFWLYFFVYLFGATLGLVFLNNLGQIAESRGCPRTLALVSLSSSFGFFGRLVPSILDYFFSRSRYMLSRPATMAVLMVPTAGAFFLLLNPSDTSLYISTAIIGISSGAITTIAVCTTTELFGMTHFGVNHNVVVANIPVGSFLFGYMAALVYRREGDGNGKCMGMDCYKQTFILWGILCLVGTFLALGLYARTRKFYATVH